MSYNPLAFDYLIAQNCTTNPFSLIPNSFSLVDLNLNKSLFIGSDLDCCLELLSLYPNSCSVKNIIKKLKN